MKDRQVWLITGAGRGLGVDIAKAALAAGHAVVATGRDPKKVTAALGNHDDLLAVKLDVTRAEDAQAAVETAVGRFGRIDVLVNNAGNFYAGFFEELSPEQVRSQIETLLFGPMNVTRAVLPMMRKQRSGLLLTISSTAGITGGMFCTAYAAAKFGVEGLDGVARPGDRTLRHPHDAGRARLLPHRTAQPPTRRPTPSPPSTTTPSAPATPWPPGTAWTASRAATPPSWPLPWCKLAGLAEPPTRFAAGADAVQTFEAKAKTLLAQADAHRALSSSLAYDDA